MADLYVEVAKDRDFSPAALVAKINILAEFLRFEEIRLLDLIKDGHGDKEKSGSDGVTSDKPPVLEGRRSGDVFLRLRVVKPKAMIERVTALAAKAGDDRRLGKYMSCNLGQGVA